MTILQPIGTQGCGCDRRDTVKALLSVDDALALIRSQTRPVDETDVLVAEHALGRILADPITALHMTPPFDNAAMDGYAVVTSALRGKGPWELPVALLHKSDDRRTSPFPGQTYPTVSVTGMPRAVKPFRMATRTWNSAT